MSRRRHDRHSKNNNNNNGRAQPLSPAAADTASLPSTHQELLTTRYRQYAVHLAWQTKTTRGKINLMPSHQVTDSLLPKHQGAIHRSLILRKDENTVFEPVVSHDNDNVLLPVCRSCGAPLQPGWDQTTLRGVASVASQQSRRKRRKQRPPAQSTPHPSLSNLGLYCWNQTSPITTTSLQYVMKCGSCGQESHISVPSKHKRNTTTRIPSAGTALHKTPPSVTTTDTQTTPQQQQATTTQPLQDFVALPVASKKRHKQQQHETTVVASRLDMPQRKKKKSHLLNFLSSLND